MYTASAVLAPTIVVSRKKSRVQGIARPRATAAAMGISVMPPSLSPALTRSRASPRSRQEAPRAWAAATAAPAAARFTGT